MTTQEEKKSPPPEPTREQGVRALLTDLVPGADPLTPEQLKECRDYCLRNTVEKDGVHVISYTFDGKPPPPVSPQSDSKFTDLEKLSPEQRDMVRAQFSKIEKVANLQFIEATPEDANEAGMSFFSAHMLEKGVGGTTFHGSLHNVILLDKKTGFTPFTILHEMGHALTLSHPNANKGQGGSGGHTEGFNQDITLMSYNPGTYNSTPSGLGYLDVAALQLIYGEPKKPIHPDVIKPAALLEESYLYDKHPLTLDLRGVSGVIPTTGSFTVDDKKITGYFVPEKDKASVLDMKAVNAYMVRDNQIKDVLADNDTGVYLELTGNALSNRLQGGSASDRIKPRGGNDVMTGHDGFNIFILDDKSGFNNVITDYNVVYKSDSGSMRSSPDELLKALLNADNTPALINTLTFKDPIAQVKLSHCDNLTVQGETYKGTKVSCEDKDGKVVASILVSDVDPKQLEANIYEKHTRQTIVWRLGKMDVYNGPSISIVPSPEDSGSQHPSGLPNLPPAGEKKRER